MDFDNIKKYSNSTFSVSLPADLLDRLDHYAEEHKMSRSRFVRSLLETYESWIKQQQKEAKQRKEEGKQSELDDFCEEE